jgi:hypothetical protein
MKTIIFSLLFVAVSFSQEMKPLSDRFAPIVREVTEYSENSFLHKVGGWDIHSILSPMKTDGDERKVYLAVVASIRGLDELIDAACSVEGFLGGKTSIMTLSDAKTYCHIPAESRRLGKEYMAREIGPLVSKCRPELQEIYKNLMAIDTEVRMLAFYNTYLKDLK